MCQPIPSGTESFERLCYKHLGTTLDNASSAAREARPPVTGSPPL